MAFRSHIAKLVLSVALALPLAAPAFAMSDQEKAEFETLIRDYLLKNPEILIEMKQALDARQEAQQREKAAKAVSENRDRIYNSTFDLALGNPKGSITIVEFFDYNCGYCKQALADMDVIIKTNPDVRFVLKEFPILGEDSMAAHKVAAAFKRIAPEKYGDFHRTLLGGRHADEATAIDVAVKLGVSEADLRAKMAESGNEDGIRETYELAEKLGVTGTPSYIVGDEPFYGAIGADHLASRVANVASCGKASC